MTDVTKNEIADKIADLLLTLEELETEKHITTKDINERLNGVLWELKHLGLRVRQGTTQEELAL